MITFSKRSEYVKNPILELNPISDALRKKGVKVIKINRGDPPIYFKTPKYIIDAYIEALKDNETAYSLPGAANTELVNAVIGRYKRMYNVSLEEEDVINTAGVTEALIFLNHSLMERGDSAVMFKPYYPQYIPRLMSEGGRAIYGNQDMDRGWDVDTEDLSSRLKQMKKSGKIRRVKYMIITNPGNPTGKVLERRTLKKIADLANEYKILLVSDEIYDEIMLHGAKFTSMAQVANGIPHLVFNGGSKNLDSTGFRIGFVVIPSDDKDSEAIKKKFYDYALTRLSLNTPAQHAIAVGMNNVKEHKKAITQMVKAIESRVETVLGLLDENPLISVVRPRSTFYVFPRIDLSGLDFKNGDEFVRAALMEEGVQLTRGSAFGTPSNFRIVALPPEETLALAVNKINEMCRRHRKG
ncbi:MAG TPA: aminotransferase class I/II-fold pyridoxal phosphate-dependent enzyme [Candidatus Saccharimonadales bacterium]|nr:aminotransferase class I/II-fold pyridoxal phosphate-dependent enzyme [Candidatus Saccharimonadales bacterium]